MGSVDGGTDKSEQQRRARDKWEWIRVVIEDERLRGTALLLVHTLAHFAAADGAQCFPSKETLAKAMHVKKSAFYDALAVVKALGYVKEGRVQTVDGRWVHGYVLTVPVSKALTVEIPPTRTEVSGYAEQEQTREQTNRGRSGTPLVAVLADAARAVSRAAADRIEVDSQVADIADECVAAGRTIADVRRALGERESPRIDHGPLWAVAVLKRVQSGKALPTRRGKNRGQSRRRGPVPRPADAFGPTTQALTGWGGDSHAGAA